jgi:hypothetical protein
MTAATNESNSWQVTAVAVDEDQLEDIEIEVITSECERKRG